MNKFFSVVLLLFTVNLVFAQVSNGNFQRKKIIYSKNAQIIDTAKVYPNSFKIYRNNKVLDTTFYRFNPNESSILFKETFTDTLEITYFRLPYFLTKTYALFTEKQVVPNGSNRLVSLSKDNVATKKLFNGLQTNGSISRGFTVGNNQNSVLNSNLDLQISGNLSSKVTLKASIQDNNIPLQDGGYSQRLDQFDQVFVEMAAKNWNIRAGDLFLENKQTQFLNFNKKVQGLKTEINWNNKNKVFLSGAVVRGQYAKSSFVGQEGNQGPYKLNGNNGELYVLIISGSEKVYVNGILLERGEAKDYIINYNAGEIIFNATYPINSEKRITIEYQFSDRNYNRFMAYGGYSFETEKFKIASFIYSESDSKNQPLQQSLTQNQVAILSNAGDNMALMNAPSESLDTYSSNKILYKKNNILGQIIYEFSNNPSDELYQVKFSFVGNNAGNYKLLSSNSVGKIYQYIAPIAGVLQGNYAPTIQLIAPTLLQVVTIKSSYQPNKKTNFNTEMAISNFDANLFSNLNDNNNQGLALNLLWDRVLLQKNNYLKAVVTNHYIQQNFKPIERLYEIEFNRNWNLLNPTGNQLLTTLGLDFNNFSNKKQLAKLSSNYLFENLTYSGFFNGQKHQFNFQLKYKKLNINSQNSQLFSKSNTSTTNFLRSQTTAKLNFRKKYLGASLKLENLQEINNNTNFYSPSSQKFTEFGQFIGVGDSTKTYHEAGYLIRTNDSVKNNLLQPVNKSFSAYYKTQLIKKENQNLLFYVNYRNLKFQDLLPNDVSINSRIFWNSNFANNLFEATTIFESVAGKIAKQEFTYLEVAATRGVYMWNDYNNNGIQELAEFEVATFPDLAKYVKIFLPNLTFVKTNQSQFSQSLTFNGAVLANKKGFGKFLSHFYNQATMSIDKKAQKTANTYVLNPFENQDNLFGNITLFRNSLFFNKGQQKHSVIYNYTQSKNKSFLNFGNQTNNLLAHQINYYHLIQKYWLVQLETTFSLSETNSDNYVGRNFNIKSNKYSPKISYLFSKNASFEINYENTKKTNELLINENLTKQQFGTAFIYNSNKYLTFNGSLNFIKNNLNGNANSAIGFQLLEGLQVGNNYTWSLNLQKNITNFLDISVNYQGRNSEENATIHNGNIKLRAYF